MSEKRVRDLKAGDFFREIGDLDESYHEVIDRQDAGSDGCRIVVAGGEVRRFRDADEVVEVGGTSSVDLGPTILAEGTFCLDCEYFEVPDDDGIRCLACGCHVARHRDAQVVTSP